MENTRTLNRNLETIAWGAFFIWWGITELFQLPTPWHGRDRHRPDFPRA